MSSTGPMVLTRPLPVSPGEVDLRDSDANSVRFMAGVLSLPIIPADQEPTIVVDAQSGTIVMNAGVELGPAVSCRTAI